MVRAGRILFFRLCARQGNRRLTTHTSPLYQADCPTEEVDNANASILRNALIVGLVIWFTQPCSARFISKQVGVSCLPYSPVCVHWPLPTSLHTAANAGSSPREQYYQNFVQYV